MKRTLLLLLILNNSLQAAPVPPAPSPDPFSKPMLGVVEDSNNPPPKGVRVQKTFLGSAAAGLKPGDVILKVSGEKILSFDQLRYMISFYRPGATIQVEGLRGDKKIDIKVKLHDYTSYIPSIQEDD